MKYIPVLAVGALAAVATPAAADVNVMLGGTVTFGANRGTELGVSLRLLENNRRDESTLGAGVTYFPQSNTVGIDVFAGYLMDHSVFGLGYDLVQGTPVMSFGYVDTEE
ncbi:hypothetical protein [Roseicyclus persicicus]|uniref:Outer membrane protein beta-barrel domain-containing protein n=1 Tax=Roseicyclus persicicus TaxID=2650661 RepID=A0A7X6JYS5_9RHOB|nr:hypothetical protein [Roseibacterium persicicum]NKX46185.1 hypothetical protein [Roseibacterium persicicum]